MFLRGALFGLGVVRRLGGGARHYPAQGREARAVALEASVGASIDQALERLDSLDRAGVLLQLADDRQTTARHRSAEYQAVAAAQRLAAGRPSPLPSALVSHQALVLDAELKAHGAQLSPEQHQRFSWPAQTVSW